MITAIEQAITERLSKGLGVMVRSVKSYNGEADDLAGQIHALPAVWITYGGSKVETMSTGAGRYQDAAEFVVMVATRNLRNDAAQRQGGIDSREIGSNDLIYAVRRLLDGQRLGFGDSRGLTPKAVRAVANHALVQTAAVSIYAVEYTIRFNSYPLENDRYPEQTDDTANPDHIFTKYRGTLSDPWPDLHGVNGKIYDPIGGGRVLMDTDLQKKEQKK
ncbi:phage protein Gp37 [Neisseria sp. S1]|uniref:phage protein Gp37 n=1 Tax=Neisseria sp. S1 TaxID=3318354 RepID=UPI003A865E22